MVQKKRGEMKSRLKKSRDKRGIMLEERQLNGLDCKYRERGDGHCRLLEDGCSFSQNPPTFSVGGATSYLIFGCVLIQGQLPSKCVSLIFEGPSLPSNQIARPTLCLISLLFHCCSPDVSALPLAETAKCCNYVRIFVIL